MIDALSGCRIRLWISGMPRDGSITVSDLVGRSTRSSSPAANEGGTGATARRGSKFRSGNAGGNVPGIGARQPTSCLAPRR
jgi:hypothetical protein